MIIKSKNKSDLVVDEFMDLLLHEKIVPGERLPTEDNLAKKFGVSRITIREAFKKLSVMGLVDIRQGEGSFVNEASPDFFMRPILPMMVLQERNMDHLYDIRRSIEAGAARSAALYRQPEDLKVLQRHQAIMEQSFEVRTKRDQERYTDADHDFHVALMKASHNAYFLKIYDAISSILKAGIEKTSRTITGRQASLSEHRAIMEAIEAKDPEQAEALMITHIENAKAYYFSNCSIRETEKEKA